MSIKRQSLWSMAPLLVVTAVNVFSVPLYYRYLGPEMYALWFYVLTFSGSFGFMDMGLGVAVGRYIGVALGKGDAESVREYWGTGNLIAIPLLAAMALVFVFVGVLFGPRWFNVSAANTSLLRWSFAVGGVGLFLSYYGQFWLILSQAYLDFKFIGILRSAVSLVQVLVAIVLAKLTGNPLLIIVWACACSAIQLLIFVWHSGRHYQLGLSLASARMARAREMASYTGKTFASLITNSLLGSIDRIVLGKIAPPAAFAHYIISVNVGGRVQSLSGAVMGPVFHNTNRNLSKESQSSPGAIYNETFDFTFGWYALFAIWMTVWHPVLLKLWLGAPLALAVSPAFTPVIIGCCLNAISSISSAQLGSLNRMGTSIAFSIVTAAALAAGVWLGWQWGGVAGVAWGFLASRLPVFVQDLFVIKMVGGKGWLGTKTWLHLAAQVAIALVFFSTSLLWNRESYWQLIPALIHGGLVAAWLLRKPISRVMGGSFPFPSKKVA